MASSSSSRFYRDRDYAEQPLLGEKYDSENDHDSDFEYGTTVATSSPAVRLGFIRRVYGLLASQLLLTSIICALFMFVPSLRHLAVAHSGILLIVSFIGTMASFFALFAKKDSYPVNLWLFLGFTIFESLLLGSICALYAASGLSSLILEALLITVAIFAGITCYAFVSKRDFSFLGGALSVALFGLLACSFINILMGVTGNGSSTFAFFISWGASVIFSLYILFDSKLRQSNLFC